MLQTMSSGNKAGFVWKRGSETVMVSNDYMCVPVVVYASAFVSLVHTRVLKWVSVCVSKIINQPQKRVVPLLCITVDHEGPEDERKR